jgi:serine/threonine protein kinase
MTPLMALTSGSRLGPYEILSPLGAGGMGEVEPPGEIPSAAKDRMTPGTRLGVYEVVAPLGAGGMGEEYRARTKLNRDVALKVLPEAFASDPQRLG